MHILKNDSIICLIFLIVHSSTDSSQPPIQYFWLLNILLRKFDTSLKKQMKMIKTQILWWKTTKKMREKYMKALSNIFIWTRPTDLRLQYPPNFRETEKIYWCHFVRWTYSKAKPEARDTMRFFLHCYFLESAVWNLQYISF